MSSSSAPYAVSEKNSSGRGYPEPPAPYRSAFERDRDRIIHCSAFRRLEGKTQVFATGINDHYRTRLTHSIEVAQIGRTIARVLKLNEALAEAVCLAHDLGHSPFGHTGEAILNELAASAGGFDHNRQSLRIVEFLEHPYPDFPGLNLMGETRTAIAKHRTPYDTPGTLAEPVCLEGQIADVADRIAYNCHDLEDGLRSRLLDENPLKELLLFKNACEKVNAEKIEDPFIRQTRVCKAILDTLVRDAIETSGLNIKNNRIRSLKDVYDCPEALIDLRASAQKSLALLEQFLMDNFYLHPSLKSVAVKVRGWLKRLFKRLTDRPSLMPRYYQNLIGDYGIERAVCDYISGMTDRYCLNLLEEK